MLRYLSKFLYILQDQKRSLLVLILLFLLVSVLETIGIGLVGPFIALASDAKFIVQNHLLHWIYTKLGLDSETQFVVIFGLLIVSIFYFKAFLSFRVVKYIFRFSYDQQGELTSRLLRTYLSVPYTFHLSRNTALLIQNTVNETERFSNTVMIPLLVSVSNFTVLCALILLLAKTSLIATLSVTGVLLLTFYCLYRFKDRISQWGKESSQAYVEMIRIINHGLGGLKETRIIGCESYFEKQIAEQSHKHAIAASSYQAFSTLPRYLIESLLVSFLVGFTIIFLLTQQSTQNLTSVMGVFAMASVRLLPSVSNMMAAFGSLRYSSYTLDKLYFDLKELEGVDVEVRDAKQPELSSDNSSSKHLRKKVLPFERQIVLEQLTYRYPDTLEDVIINISLTIEKGQSIGIIGKSGGGKTTLVDVVLGLLTPKSGDIKADRGSIYSDLRSWQNMIGYIPQTIFLIDDTIERNIAFGVPDHLIDAEKLSKAIQAAQLTELIEQLPDGIKTVIGERGIRLSGGQRQRVGIARALYHEREILVLDEATSALDNETESLVTEAIKSLARKKTMIIIAHRLSTIEHCDRIYLLDKGKVVKSGSYQEVISQLH